MWRHAKMKPSERKKHRKLMRDAKNRKKEKLAESLRERDKLRRMVMDETIEACDPRADL